MSDDPEEISYKSPIYLQMRELIRKKINDGEYLPGASLPSENDLAAAYGINRLTVRNAMSKLVNEGLLKRVQGKGVYVVPERMDRDLERLGGFTQVAREKRRRLQARILTKVVRKAGEKYAIIFHIHPDDEIYYLRQLSTADNEPISLDEIYIPKYVLPRLEEIDLSVFSFDQVFDLSGVKIVRAYQTLDLTTLEQNDARTLGINTAVAVMLFECTSFDDQERVVEFSRTYTRGDQCDFHVKFSE